MKRAGFTMIELIFVIVILGILSAVALPKFIGVSEQAKAGKCKAFVGTLNRSVGPTAWSQSITDGNNGSVANYLSDGNISTYINVPSECNATAVNSSYTDIVVGNHTFTFGSQYDMNFTDGNASTAPSWTWTKH